MEKAIGEGAGDGRDDQVSQDVVADLGEDVVAQQDGPRAAGGGDQPVDQCPDAGHIGQEVGGEDQHDDRVGQGAEHRFAGA